MQQASCSATDAGGAGVQDPSFHGYRTRRYSIGKAAVIAPDVVKRNCDVIRPNKVWVTDITYIRTWQGWLYLAVVVDLFSRLVIRWATGSSLRGELVLDAVMMAARRRRPRSTVIHSDQGCQYGSDDWRRASVEPIGSSRA